MVIIDGFETHIDSYKTGVALDKTFLLFCFISFFPHGRERLLQVSRITTGPL